VACFPYHPTAGLFDGFRALVPMEFFYKPPIGVDGEPTISIYLTGFKEPENKKFSKANNKYLIRKKIRYLFNSSPY